MKLHANARLSVKGRELLVDRLAAGWSLTEAAMAAGVSERTARKWRERYRTEGPDGLVDRSSAPGSVPTRTTTDDHTAQPPGPASSRAPRRASKAPRRRAAGG